MRSQASGIVLSSGNYSVLFEITKAAGGMTARQAYVPQAKQVLTDATVAYAVTSSTLVRIDLATFAKTVLFNLPGASLPFIAGKSGSQLYFGFRPSFAQQSLYRLDTSVPGATAQLIATVNSGSMNEGSVDGNYLAMDGTLVPGASDHVGFDLANGTMFPLSVRQRFVVLGDGAYSVQNDSGNQLHRSQL